MKSAPVGRAGSPLGGRVDSAPFARAGSPLGGRVDSAPFARAGSPLGGRVDSAPFARMDWPSGGPVDSALFAAGSPWDTLRGLLGGAPSLWAPPASGQSRAAAPALRRTL